MREVFYRRARIVIKKSLAKERKKDTRVKETLVRKLSRAGPLATYKDRSV